MILSWRSIKPLIINIVYDASSDDSVFADMIKTAVHFPPVQLQILADSLSESQKNISDSGWLPAIKG